MLRIGYLRLTAAGEDDPSAALRSLGCQVIRIEDDHGADGAVLASILDFIGPDDELVAPSLPHLSRSPRALLDLLDRLEERSAALVVADPPLRSSGSEGAALRAALQAVAPLEPAEPLRRRTRAPAHEIRALQRAGVGPVEIARRLGVSRMTVWRKLKAVQA